MKHKIRTRWNLIQQSVSNDTQSNSNQACTYDSHQKGNQFTFLESLARLAYNKGTALFRGNDPLRRSAAETFSLIINPPAQARKTCSTWVRDGRKAVLAQGEHINQERFVRHSLQPTQRKRVPCVLSPKQRLFFALSCGMN